MPASDSAAGSDRGGPNDRARGPVLLLDLDGTLVDSEELILSSYRHTMRRHRDEVPPDSVWLDTMGQPLLAQLRDFARDEEEARAMMETYREHNHRAHDDLLRPFPGVREYVERLLGDGVRTAIVTSKLRDAALRALETCGYEPGRFGAIVTASDVERHKPDPEPVRRALTGLGEPAGGAGAGSALFVGDSVWDIRAGRAAGVRTAAALWGPYDREQLAPAGPDHWLEDIEGLGRLLPGRSSPAG